jgi:hypothetical protein
MCLNYQGATVACQVELSNLSKELLQQYFAKLPFEKSIFVYPQNLWITLWADQLIRYSMWRGVRDFVSLPIFY